MILRTGRTLTDRALAHLKGAPSAVIKRLIGCGWEVRVGWAKCFIPAVRYAAASKEGAATEYSKGDVRYASHELETFIVSARKVAPVGRMALEATWTRKNGASFTFEGARTNDPILGEEWRPKASSPRPAYEWEIEEGIEPPVGFNTWLKMVAPTAAETKKRKAEKETA